jgi:hypothetical protein
VNQITGFCVEVGRLIPNKTHKEPMLILFQLSSSLFVVLWDHRIIIFFFCQREATPLDVLQEN